MTICNRSKAMKFISDKIHFLNIKALIFKIKLLIIIGTLFES